MYSVSLPRKPRNIPRRLVSHRLPLAPALRPVSERQAWPRDKAFSLESSVLAAVSAVISRDRIGDHCSCRSLFFQAMQTHGKILPRARTIVWRTVYRTYYAFDNVPEDRHEWIFLVCGSACLKSQRAVALVAVLALPRREMC